MCYRSYNSCQRRTLMQFLQSVKQQNPTEKQLDQTPTGKDDNVTDEDNVSNFRCRTCGMKYARKDNLIRHQQNHSNINYECEHCGFTTKRKDVLTKHMKRKHECKEKSTEGRQCTTPRTYAMQERDRQQQL
ncbi:Hypothetical predicted protein [Mytilus galloprovincialis]|uniref:C2H2-type domain-containing protein n=1 Tax=Mytilus galloprovincialis TaxID=29158 RepID=A0A8B6ER54_MYTGA|nr:Hypothetical predicted protein [Mytilus galloprovincialis]